MDTVTPAGASKQGDGSSYVLCRLLLEGLTRDCSNEPSLESGQTSMEAEKKTLEGYLQIPLTTAVVP